MIADPMNGFVGGRKSSKGDSSKLWDVFSLVACTLIMVLGVCVWAVSGNSLSGITASHGQFLGATCVVLAVLGLLASSFPLLLPSNTPVLGGFSSSQPGSAAKQWASRCSLPMRVALLVGLGLTALGSILLLDQVAHDVGAHCVVAEASVRINHLEEAVTKLRTDEMLTQDRDLIRERVQRLRHHAEQLLDDMAGSVARTKLELSEAATEQNLLQEGADIPLLPTQPGGNAAGSSSRWSARSVEEIRQEKARLQKVAEEKKIKEQSMWILEKRIEAVQSVLQYLDARSHDAHAALTFEEYEVILNALLDGATNLPNLTGTKNVDDPSQPAQPSMITALVRENLEKDKDAVDETKNAFARRKSGAYEKLAGAPSKATKEVASRQQQARAEWEARFFGSYEGGAGHTNPSIFSNTLAQALDSLPRHCLDDVAAYATLRWLGLGLLLAQISAGYVAATSLATRIVAAGKHD